jgi:hypothetical protein
MTEAPTQAQGQATPEALAAPETPQDSTQVQGQDSGTNEGKTLTWEEHQAELKRIGTKEKKEGRGARDNELLQKTGAESIDDLLAAYTSQQEMAAELEGQEITDLKKQHREALKAAQDDLKAHQDALGAILEKQREGLAEHYIPLLDKMSAPEQLAYIAEHGEAMRGEDKPLVPPSIGAGSSPGNPGNRVPQDPKERMGQSMLGWLTEPMPGQGNTWP